MRLDEKLDDFSNETIKNSLIYKSAKNIRAYTLSKIQNKTISNIFYSMLLLVISILFISLSLPQFANDKIGIGFIIIICNLLFILYAGLSKDFKFKFNIIDLLVIIFFLTLIISTFNSYFIKASLIGFSKYSLYISFYFLVKFTLLNSNKQLMFNFWILLLFTACTVSAIGIYQYFIGIPPLATWEDPGLTTHTRAYSTLGNPNLLGGHLALFLPISLILSVEKKLNPILRIFLFGAAIVFLICIIFTGSRGAYIGTGAGLLSGFLIFINSGIKKKNKVSLICLSLLLLSLILIFMFPMARERIASVFSFWDYSTNVYRLNVWSACLQLLKDNFIFGIGPGNYTFILGYGLYMNSAYNALGAYNVFLEIAVETGILGLFIFSLILLVSFLKLHVLYWDNGDKKYIFSLGIFISILILLTHGMVDTVFFRPQIFIPFWFLLASIDKLNNELKQI